MFSKDNIMGFIKENPKKAALAAMVLIAVAVVLST